MPTLIADDPMDVFRGRPLKLLRDSQHPDDRFLSAFAESERSRCRHMAAVAAAPRHHIRVTYHEAARRRSLRSTSTTSWSTTTPICRRTPWLVVEPLITALNNDAMTTIEHLVADANAEIPANWWMTQNDGGAVEFVAAHDAAWAERGGTPDEHSVAPGYYVNGELEERPAEPTPPAKFDDLPDTGHGIGQWASLGGNESINAALIADIGEGVRTMVVMGDYYKTDAIFQTNTIVDKDQVHVSGGEGKPSVTSEGNVATNIADFPPQPQHLRRTSGPARRLELDRR